MGSAFLVGSALDQAHHPFLGWLWQATRVLLLVLALTAAVTLCFADGFSETVRRTRNELRWEEPPTSAASAVTPHCTPPQEMSGRRKAMSQRISSCGSRCGTR